MKKRNRPQAYRIRRILEMIRAGMKGQRLCSAKDFANELEVSWRTVIRDLDYLRDDEGAPIEYNASRKGYVLSNRSWQLKPVTLNQGEVFAFSVASRMLQPFRGTPLEMDISSLFDKISQSLQGDVVMSVDALTDHLSVIHDDYVPVDRERWLEVAHAIDCGERVKVRYRTFVGDIKSIVLSPVQLVAYHGNWYALAFRPGKCTPGTYALSRMLSMKQTGLPVQVPDEFDTRKHIASIFDISHGEKEYKVHLRFSKNVATYISERIWHPSQTFTRKKNGSMDMKFSTKGWKELVRWILSWQPDVEVLAPIELRERVRAKMRQGLTR